MKFNNLWGYFKKMSKYYEILGINQVFKPEELNDATIDKIKNVINTDEKKALEICEAYCVLSNEKEKKVYDDAPDTYVFNDSKPFIKKPEKVLTDIKTEIYNVKYHHENAKKKYLGQAIGGFAGCVAMALFTILPIIFRLTFGIVIFPSLALGSLTSGFIGIKNYIETKKLDKRFTDEEIWDQISIP